MREHELFTLVRSTLLTGLTARYGAGAVSVRAVYQPQQFGAPKGPTVTMQTITARRIGALRRDYRPAGGETIPAVMTQWWEATLQIGAIARRLPEETLSLPSANDILRTASDILQSDAGMTAMAAQRVRPLRIADVRNLQWVNESDQYESMPSFDLILSYPEILTAPTDPVATFEHEGGPV